MSASKGSLTFREIAEQPQAMSAAYEEALRRKDWAEAYLADPAVRQTLFIGSGSSYYQSMTMASTCQSWLGRSASALPSSELLLLRGQAAIDRMNTVVIGVSRSGESSEVVKALETVKPLPGWKRAGVTCYAGSSMAKLADSLISGLGAERSMVMTKSLSSMIVSIQTSIAYVSNQAERRLDELAALVEGQAKRISTARELAQDLVAARHFERTVFLGMGAMYGVAQEGCMKLKEMSNAWTESFGTLEFRHGPKSIVDSHTCVVVLVSEQSRPEELKVAREMQEYGAHVVVVAASEDADVAFADTFVETGLPRISDEARVTAALPFLQYYGYFTALKRGNDPDHPRNLAKVVIL